ncbi:importin subunit alpha-2, partial [Tanacetum coccineum]
GCDVDLFDEETKEEKKTTEEHAAGNYSVSQIAFYCYTEDFPQLQALANIASGTSENTNVVIDHGVVPIFVKLLASPSDDVREEIFPLDQEIESISNPYWVFRAEDYLINVHGRGSFGASRRQIGGHGRGRGRKFGVHKFADDLDNELEDYSYG